MKLLLLWVALPVLSTGVVPVGPGDLQGVEEEAESSHRETRTVARLEVRCSRLEPPAVAPTRPTFPARVLTLPGFLKDPGPALARFHLRSPSA